MFQKLSIFSGFFVERTGTPKCFFSTFLKSEKCLLLPVCFFGRPSHSKQNTLPVKESFCLYKCKLFFFTHSYLEIHKMVVGKSADLDQTPHNVVSDQGLHCLVTGFSIKNRIKATK